MTDFYDLTLETLCGGKAEEQFQAALQQVVANIDDVSTSAKKKRKIVLTIEFEPLGEDRRQSSVSVSASPGLAAPKPEQGIIYHGYDKQTNTYKVNTHDPRQQDLWTKKDQEHAPDEATEEN